MEYLILTICFGYLAALIAALVWNIVGAVHIKLTKPASTELHNVGHSPTIVVILIHGTCARRASWTRNNSALCCSISSALPNETVRFESFRWSGWNSISARYKAGYELATFLRSSQEKWPGALHFIIGHSHGGSVALSGLQHELIRQNVAGVVCLSTPFLIARPRFLSRIAGAGHLVTPALLAVFGLGYLSDLPQIKIAIDRHELLQTIFGLMIISCAIFAAFRAPRIFEALSAKILAKMELAELKQDQLLIIRAPGDEASAALGAAQILNFVVSRIWDSISYVLDAAIRRTNEWGDTLRRFGWRTHILNLFSIAAAIAINDWIPEKSGIGAIVIDALRIILWGAAIISWSLLLSFIPKAIGLLILGVVALPLLAALAILALPIGPELSLVSLMLNVTAESTPLGTWVVRQLRSDDSFDSEPEFKWALMHSVSYEHPTALAQLACWIKERIASSR